jgi:hypothetical protein
LAIQVPLYVIQLGMLIWVIDHLTRKHFILCPRGWKTHELARHLAVILPSVNPSLPTGCVVGADPSKYAISSLSSVLIYIHWTALRVNVNLLVPFMLVPSLIFDLTTIVLLVLASRRRLGQTRLYDIILRDGTIYFLAVFATNLAWTITGLVLSVSPLSQYLPAEITHAPNRRI